MAISLVGRVSGTVVCALLAAACGARSDLDDGGAGGQGGLGPVTGTWIDTYVTKSGDVATPLDLGAATISAMYQDAAGNWLVTSGVGTSDGTFTIDDVPDVPFFVTVKSADHYRAHYTDARHVDFGDAIAGRPPAPANAVYPAAVSLHATGLAPWKPTDFLDVFSYDSSGFAKANVFAPPGATEADVPHVAWAGAGTPTQGDRVYVDQFVQYQSTNGAPYACVVQSGADDDLAVAADGSAHLDVALAPAPLEKLAFQVHPDAFESMIDAVPLVHAGAGGIAVLAAPGKSSRAVQGGNATFLRAAMPHSTFAIDADCGDPFPPEWGRVAESDLNGSAEFSIGGAPPIDGIPVLFGAEFPLDTGDAVDVRPVVGPPAALHIDDLDATEERTVSSTGARLTWSAPSLGAPSLYQVEMFELEVSDGSTYPYFRGAITTDRTDLPLAPGFVEAGKPYVFVVSAHAGGTAEDPRPIRGWAAAPTNIVHLGGS